MNLDVIPGDVYDAWRDFLVGLMRPPDTTKQSRDLARFRLACKQHHVDPGPVLDAYKQFSRSNQSSWDALEAECRKPRLRRMMEAVA